MVNFQTLAATLALPLAVVAHPGDNTDAIKREMAQRNTQHAYASRAISQCQNTPQALALKQRTAERRAAKAIELREKRGLSHSKYTPVTKRFVTVWSDSPSDESALYRAHGPPEERPAGVARIICHREPQ